MVDTDGHRRPAPCAVPRDGQLLITDRGWARKGPAGRRGRMSLLAQMVKCVPQRPT